jgi:hypothetical protein
MTGPGRLWRRSGTDRASLTWGELTLEESFLCALPRLLRAYRLRCNNLTPAGAAALGPLCPDNLVVGLDDPLDRILADERNKARLIRQFGSTPLQRFRLYLCGFGGASL